MLLVTNNLISKLLQNSFAFLILRFDLVFWLHFLLILVLKLVDKGSLLYWKTREII